ncbi:MAG: phosphoadenylyl-sulfate reductase [Anaerolineae bacterium]|nr:phosphoadenylyl-sulfate reductase [Anaerolineae bacterium]
MINIENQSERLETMSPQAILRWAVDCYGEQLAVVTSFQPTGVATLHMLYELGVRPQVFTLDTGLLFPETYRLMDELEALLDLRLERVKPELTVEAQAERYGAALWESAPDTCCMLRKVVPLGTALQGYDAWITGLRRDQPGRACIPIMSWDHKYEKTKLSPLANWDESMIWTYIHAHELPYNDLHDRGYPSIGCNTPTCTQPVKTGQNTRAGRWVNHAKNECGLHVLSINLDGGC